jgi:hypothetical protein
MQQHCRPCRKTRITMPTTVALQHKTHRRPAAAPQLLSPLFALPSELRLEVYEYLDFPPIQNYQCHGLILSCRRAKLECEDVAVKTFKTWIALQKQVIDTKCTFGVRILLPLLPPIGTSFRFNTIRELTLVLPSSSFELTWDMSSFFDNFRNLNPILGLWLEKLTIHFRGFLGHEYEKSHLQKCYRRLQFLLQGGMRWAHDPIGEATGKERTKYSWTWDHWQPEPSFIKKLILSWDVTEQGLSSDDRVHLEGVGQPLQTSECVGRRMYRVISDNGFLGELMLESCCRFRPSERERHMIRPNEVHRETCFKCSYNWNYTRYIRGLPIDADERWI